MAQVSFDSLSLACIVSQLQTWNGARVRKIAQPSDTRAILTMYHPTRGETRWLWECSARGARTHLSSRREKTLEPAPNFCQALRKHLEGAELRKVEQVGFDRILRAHFDGVAGALTLVAELMGKHSNLLLLDEQERILSVAKPISSRVNRVRTLLPNRAYELPPRAELLDPRNDGHAAFDLALNAEKPADFASWLRARYEGISPFLAGELATRAQTQDAWSAFASVFELAHDGQWSPVLVRDERGLAGAYPLPLVITDNTQSQADFSAALDEAWAQIETREHDESQRSTLTGQLQSALRSRDHAIAQLEAGLQEGGRASKLRHRGDLILAYAYEISPGASEAFLPDWNADNEVVRVPLDPELSPQDNAALLFERAKKAEAGRARLGEQLQLVRKEADELRAALNSCTSANENELATLRALATQKHWLQVQTVGRGEKTSEPNFDGFRVRALTSPDGYTVLLGENALANDYLVRRASQGSDYWLHARAGTSAHGIIKTNNQPERVPMTTLRFAAEQVARRSIGKHSGVVAVDYTLRKYVRRPRKGAPGSVLREREKTIDVSPSGED